MLSHVQLKKRFHVKTTSVIIFIIIFLFFINDRLIYLSLYLRSQAVLVVVPEQAEQLCERYHSRVILDVNDLRVISPVNVGEKRS